MSLIVSEQPVGYALKKPRMTAAEFLAWDEGQTAKHEFVRGEVFLMTGGVDRNYTVALNLAIALRQHLSGTPCRVYGSDVKLRVEAADCYFYPDLMVTCSAADAADRLIKREPVLVVEVLSPSTAATSLPTTARWAACANTCWSTSTGAAASCTAWVPMACGCCTPAHRAKACGWTAST